jgi:hypothetical protein
MQLGLQCDGWGRDGELGFKGEEARMGQTLAGIRRTGRREWVTLQQPSGMRRKGRRVIQLAGGRDELSRQSGCAFMTGAKRARRNWVRKKGWVMWASPVYYVQKRIWELLLGNA